MEYIIAVDTGGTFTDCVIVDSDGGYTRAKSNSTPQDFSIGVINAVAKGSEQIGLPLGDLLGQTKVFSHGTTIATNAFITGNVSKTGLITTMGAEDTILIGRGGFQKTAGLTEAEIGDSARLEKPQPLVPRQFIRGVVERIDRNGEIVLPLDEAQTVATVRQMLDEGVEAIAVCLLWSFKNAVHERRIKELVHELSPDTQVSISSDLVPVIGEYQRTVTTVINASLNRITSQHLDRLQQKLHDGGFQLSPLIMQSTGGVVTFNRASDESVSLLSSGPAGGLIGCLVSGMQKGYPKVLSTDVGGTSFDVGMIADGKPYYAHEPVLARYHIKIPMLQVESIGAGGGSIAWNEPGTSYLKVGPMSAGAEPGPACYDLGGDEPTVTDADILLNRLNPDYFLGGSVKLNREKSVEVIRKKIAEPLRISAEEAAMSIIKIADAKMADLVRKVTISKGDDPRDFVIYAFGGAGPVHAAAYAKDVGGKTVVVPTTASVYSAFGIAASDFLRIKEVSSPVVVFPDAAETMNSILDGVRSEVIEELTAEGVPRNQIAVESSLDLRYLGQLHEVRVPLADGGIDAPAVGRILDDFARIYEETYGTGTAFGGAPIQAVIFRVVGRGEIAKPAQPKYPDEGPDCKAAIKAQREVYWEELGGMASTNIYEMDLLRTGNALTGPAIVESVDTTFVIHPGQNLTVDESRDLILTL
jgi:N-methylhydantoinase A